MARILVADDQPNVCELLERALSTEGHEVLVAPDGPDAWRLLVAERPAVAVLDITMPPPDGIELTRAIKGDPALAGTYVILLTAHGAEADVRTGLEAGADRYLIKPVRLASLRAAVAQALAGSQPPGAQDQKPLSW